MTNILSLAWLFLLVRLSRLVLGELSGNFNDGNILVTER
jgi:hypothetical protein